MCLVQDMALRGTPWIVYLVMQAKERIVLLLQSGPSSGLRECGEHRQLREAADVLCLSYA